VEDEFLLRLDSADTIESAGFEVIQAANADEAIAMLETHPDIHVVFTTKTLPKVAAEMALSVLAYNLTRVMNIVGIKPLIAAISRPNTGPIMASDQLPYESVFTRPRPHNGPRGGRCQ
jgi:hypothetical protein